MNMLALSFLALVICSVVAFQPDEYFAQEYTSLANMSCELTQKPCALGCCPFVDGVCCADGFECCQNGKICIPFIGICVGVVNDEKNGLSLVSSKSTPTENLITACPPGTTTCGVDKCCLYTHATCCSDGEHCCPYGTRCDLSKGLCIKDSFNYLIPTASEITSVPAAKAVKKSPFKSCPGSDKLCPSYSSCCIADNGQWGCCPNPSLSRLGVVGSECCDTVFGWMCCPDGYLPHCTLLGCTL